jgi:hypothetical protein
MSCHKKKENLVSGTRSRGRHRQPRRPEDGSAVLRADDLAAADPKTRLRTTSVVFYGRTAHAAATPESQAERHRQLAPCRAAVAAYGGQVTTVYFDENCRADHPWNRRPRGRALLSTLSGPENPAWTLVAADAWRLLPRRMPADGTAILQQLAQRHVLLVLADTGTGVLTLEEYTLLGRLMSGSVAATGLAVAPSRPLPSATRHAARQSRR